MTRWWLFCSPSRVAVRCYLTIRATGFLAQMVRFVVAPDRRYMTETGRSRSLNEWRNSAPFPVVPTGGSASSREVRQIDPFQRFRFLALAQLRARVMETPHHLTRRGEYLLAVAAAVVTANAYYIHPFIGDVAHHFGVSTARIGEIPLSARREMFLRDIQQRLNIASKLSQITSVWVPLSVESQCSLAYPQNPPSH